jgi:hypothetical protein
MSVSVFFILSSDSILQQKARFVNEKASDCQLWFNAPPQPKASDIIFRKCRLYFPRATGRAFDVVLAAEHLICMLSTATFCRKRAFERVRRTK